MNVDLFGEMPLPRSVRRAGMGSHHSAASQSDVWLTPPWLLTALGEFDLDPCAAPEPRPWPTAAEHYAEANVDGLASPWHGRVWLNPPYSALEPWMTRLAAHGTGTALVFARTETKWFHEAVWPQASGLLFLAGRVTFHHQDGRESGYNSGAPSVLVAYGPGDAYRLRNSGLAGAFMPIHRPEATTA